MAPCPATLPLALPTSCPRHCPHGTWPPPRGANGEARGAGGGPLETSPGQELAPRAKEGAPGSLGRAEGPGKRPLSASRTTNPVMSGQGHVNLDVSMETSSSRREGARTRTLISVSEECPDTWSETSDVRASTAARAGETSSLGGTAWRARDSATRLLDAATRVRSAGHSGVYCAAHSWDGTVALLWLVLFNLLIDSVAESLRCRLVPQLEEQQHSERLSAAAAAAALEKQQQQQRDLDIELLNQARPSACARGAVAQRLAHCSVTAQGDFDGEPAVGE
ncbi:unnamed protein product [Lampetra fluviatilis]